MGGDPGGGFGFGNAFRIFWRFAVFWLFSRCFGGGPAGGIGLGTEGAAGTRGFVSPDAPSLGGFARGGLGPGMTAGGSPGGGLGLLAAAVCSMIAGLTGLGTLLPKNGGRTGGKVKGWMPAGGGRTGGAILGTVRCASGIASGWRSPAKTCQLK